MKPKAFAKLLDTYADLQTDLGARGVAEKTRELSQIFAASTAPTVDAALSSAQSWIDASRSSGLFGKRVSDQIPSLSALEAFLQKASTAAKHKPVKRLLSFLTEHQNMEWSALTGQLKTALSAKDEDVIAFYVQRLSETYKDKAAFPKIFESLKKDKRVKVADALKIATEFSGHTVKGTKAKAFVWIWKQHDYYISGLATAEALRGKSAA